MYSHEMLLGKTAMEKLEKLGTGIKTDREAMEEYKKRKEDAKMNILENLEVKALYELKGRVDAVREYYQNSKYPNAEDMAAILGIKWEGEKENDK